MFGPTRAQSALTELNQLNGILKGNLKSGHLNEAAVQEIQNAIIRLAKEIADYYETLKVERLKKKE